MKKFLILPVVLVAFTLCHAQKSALILNLQKDVEYLQSTNSESIIDQDINGQNMNMVMTIKGQMSFLVKAVNDKGYDMDATYKSLSMTMQLPQGTMDFSSEKDSEDDIFSLILSEMKDKPFQVKMTKYGKISEVKNIDALYESALSKFPEIPAAQLEQIRTQMSKAYGEDAFKGNIEMVTAIYPEEKVTQGDEWVVNTKLESGMSANMTTTYKLSGSTEEHYLIAGESKIETIDKEAYVESNGMPMRFDLTGTMVSDIKIDKESGWIVEAKVTQEIQGDTFIQENPQMPNGMKIPMVMKSKMTYTNN